jgi:hypothetical protein
MANNITVGPNAVVAKAASSFVDAGITGTNTTVIYRVGASLASYKPGRPINGVTAFEEGKGYYLVAKQAMDLEAFVVPPLEEDSLPETLLDVTFNSAADLVGWTKDPPDAGAGDFEFVTNGGVTKLHMTCEAGEYLEWIKAGLFTIGDVLRITFTGVTIISGTPRFFIGGVAHNFAAGDTVQSPLDTTGGSVGAFVLDCTVSTQYFIRGIKIERL